MEGGRTRKISLSLARLHIHDLSESKNNKAYTKINYFRKISPFQHEFDLSLCSHMLLIRDFGHLVGLFVQKF